MEQARHTFYGDQLDDAITNVSAERQPIVENLLYEKSALLLYADDGIGKSVLALQCGMTATVKDAKVFGSFNVPEARKVLHLQMERHPDETFERMKHMRDKIPYDKSNFVLSVALQGVNLQDKESSKEAQTRFDAILKEISFKPHIITVDPIYALCVDGLETAAACNSITRFFRIIQLQTNATILATSHTNRGIRNDKGQRIGKDMYGNRFLSAFFNGSYQLEAKDSDGSGSTWTRNKNSLKALENTFSLNYDASNYCSWIDQNGRQFSKKDKLDNFLATCKTSKKTFTFDDMKDNSGVSDSTLRGYLAGYLCGVVVEVSKLKYGKVLYAIS